MTERGLFELYQLDPERADSLLWARTSYSKSRRGFFKDSGKLALATALGAPVVFSDLLPSGLIPLALGSTTEQELVKTKDGLIILNDRPLSLETPPHLLDDEYTPVGRLFVRNNGYVPQMALKKEAKGFVLTIDGEVEKSLQLSLKDLKSEFKQYTRHYVLECGGNGRLGFSPPTKGNQWSYGAVGCPRWTGVLLRDVLQKAGVKKTAVYTGYYGMDTHLSGNPNKPPISRGTPIAKALDDSTMLVWAMNGEELPALHGFPLRLVVPGYPGSTSGKWVNRITLRDQVHDGPKMNGYSYRVPKDPVAPGSRVAENNMVIIEQMPVKSLITFPKSGTKVKSKGGVLVRGFAWTAEESISKVEISINFGATFQKAKLSPARNRYGWQRFEAMISLPQQGYYEVWSKATDSKNNSQPMVVPGWNPKGYLNNAMPRIAVVST